MILKPGTILRQKVDILRAQYFTGIGREAYPTYAGDLYVLVTTQDIDSQFTQAVDLIHMSGKKAVVHVEWVLYNLEVIDDQG